ncbi:lytic transglycosylase domain-containing protein [Aquabacterium soli]|uniref:Lytic transglycosylase domain-containing protein n=2 Tax=Aquabacterium soli TaxID=2493092 RepID=A0A3R8S4P1_9BURK|nr:lytic transglycosylase domain-containing protein [Aquabacterium soli]
MRLWTDHMGARKAWAPRWLAAPAALLAALATMAPPPAQAQTTGEDTLMAARSAFLQRDRSRLAAARDTLMNQNHPLAAWADFWFMQSRLIEAGPTEVDQFLARWGDAYVADRLRNDWLLELGRRRDWKTFARVQPYFRMNDDRDVTCLGVLARQQLGVPMQGLGDLREQARQAWWAQKDADFGCDTMAQALFAARILTPADVWRKLRLSQDFAQPKAITQSVRLLGEPTAQAVARLMGNAQRFLMTDNAVRPESMSGNSSGVAISEAVGKKGQKAAKANKRKPARALVPPPPAVPADHVGPLNLLALLRWSSQDPEAAAAALVSPDAARRWHLTREDMAWAWASTGRSAAWRLMPQAITYFERALVPGELTEGSALWATTWHPDTLAWMTRAALRSATSGQPAHWLVVDTAIEAMSPEQKTDPTWVYWKARSLQAQAPAGAAGEPRRQQAREMLARIAQPTSFYGLLAMDDLGRVGAPPRPAKPSRDELQQAAAVPGLDRALRLYDLGLRSEGAREWNYTLSYGKPGGLSDRELMAAAEIACDREYWDRCINTSDRTKQEIDLYQRYPLAFRRDIQVAAKDVGLDPAFMFGLIRQESRFQISARSHVGASGLMQVMPATADWVARRLGMSDYHGGLITDRDTNLKLGAGYLKLVLDDFNGSAPMAAAAYNAGPGRPRKWRDGPRLEPAVWAENVPFNETRDYVKKVVTNAVIYGHVLHGKPLSIKTRLGPVIGPRTSSAPPDDLP